MRVLLAVAVVGTFLSAAIVQTASAGGSDKPSAAPLTGEVFLATEVNGSSTITGTCDPLSTSTFTFTVTGIAMGPYPGTFTEEGTFTLGPFGAPPFSLEPESFESSFTITSMAGTVQGTKELAIGPSPRLGICGEAAAEEGGPNAITFAHDLTYTATITTGGRTTTDRGNSHISYQDLDVRRPGLHSIAFDEDFTSTGGGDDEGDDDDDDEDDDD